MSNCWRPYTRQQDTTGLRHALLRPRKCLPPDAMRVPAPSRHRGSGMPSHIDPTADVVEHNGDQSLSHVLDPQTAWSIFAKKTAGTRTQQGPVRKNVLPAPEHRPCHRRHMEIFQTRVFFQYAVMNARMDPHSPNGSECNGLRNPNQNDLGLSKHYKALQMFHSVPLTTSAV